MYIYIYIYIYIFPQSFIEICLKFKFLCSKTDFLKKNIQNFRTLKKTTCPYGLIRIP